MKSHLLAALVGLSLFATACADPIESDREGSPQNDESALAAPAALGEVLDISKGACAKTHPLIGRDVPLTTRAHGVSGAVRVVDDCTIVISNFAYDGKGRKVELYGASGGSFKNGVALSADILRPSKPYSGAQLIVRLPSSIKLRDLDAVSVWCSDVNVSFADASLR